MAIDPHAYTTADSNQRRRPDACVLTIFGASGDLTKRKLIPALYNLALEKRLPESFAVVGYARSEMSHEEFRLKMHETVSKFSRTGLKDESVWQQFASALYYVQGSYEASRVIRSSSNLSTDSIAAAASLPCGFSTWRRRPSFTAQSSSKSPR